jgi:hypothetical protein
MVDDAELCVVQPYGTGRTGRSEFTLMPIFVRALRQKIRNCATMLSSALCPMRETGLK